MTEITKIVLTGGPCGGKTSAISVLHEQLSSYGVDVFEVNEQATSLKRSGKTPESMGTYEFHSLLFSNQLAEENAAFERCVDVMTELILKYGPSLKRRWALEKLMANVWLDIVFTKVTMKRLYGYHRLLKDYRRQYKNSDAA